MDTWPTSTKMVLELLGGALGVWLSVKVMEQIKQADWTADQCVYMGTFIAGLIGIVAWGLGGFMGYNTFPATVGEYWWRGWIEAIVAVGLTTGAVAKVYYDTLYHPAVKADLEQKGTA
jgi:hypothetical protein